MGTILSINISRKKGEKKTPVQEALVKENLGIIGDAHAGDKTRQVSLLAQESINKMAALGLNVSAGDFAENITISEMNLLDCKIGTKLKLGNTVQIEISQIGKVCHDRCAIYYQAGDCIMPKEGIFAKVLRGGKIKIADEIKII
jgi:MOSC domain-containing protein YiiM